MRAATVTRIAGGSFYAVATSIDPARELGPMEAATPAPIVGDRVLIAERLDVPGSWVIVATMPPA